MSETDQKVLQEAERDLENAQLAVCDVAAEFVDGHTTIDVLRDAVVEWRECGEALIKIVIEQAAVK